jgi:hypothetical protein
MLVLEEGCHWGWVFGSNMEIIPIRTTWATKLLDPIQLLVNLRLLLHVIVVAIVFGVRLVQVASEATVGNTFRAFGRELKLLNVVQSVTNNDSFSLRLNWMLHPMSSLQSRLLVILLPLPTSGSSRVR